MQTIRQKVLAIVLLTTFVVQLVTLGSIVVYEFRVSHKALIADMVTQSELLGQMTEPALAFDDRRLALENLNLLRFRPAVRAAAIYQGAGGLFAGYGTAAEQRSLPATPGMDSVRVIGTNLIVFKRIVRENTVLGTVYLRAEYKLVDRFLTLIGITVVVMAMGMLLAYVMTLRLQRVITDPILAVRELARDVVVQRDYSRRVEKTSDDEVGQLVDSFNAMLVEIERRTQDLETSYNEILREAAARSAAQEEIQRLNADLETRVRVRTEELEVANRELALAKSAAEHSDQAKSAFLSSMSHELRTPLNVVLGFAQLLNSDAFPVTEDQRRHITENILKAGQHLLALINEVLDLAKIESGTLTLSLEPVAIAELIEEGRVMMAPMADARNVRMIFPEASGLRVVADRTRLKQVLLNLLSNAIKYNREGGTVIIDAAIAASGRVRVSVQDTGAGLDVGRLQQLFQPFNRLGQEAGSIEGTGIGLVVTKRLIELMGGAIGVNSTVGAGSVFWIEVEACPAEAIGAASAATETVVIAADEPLAMTPRKVLYVEDNPMNMKLVEELLSFRTDLTLLSAANANLGIELARAHQPAVILMDINLPGMSGNEALELLHHDARTSHIPVIAITANAMPREVARGLSRGYFRYITKPLNIDEFMEALDSALKLNRDGAES